MTLLDVEDLDAGYGDFQVLSKIHLKVDDGEFVSIVGPNGAGKSTVMKSIVGLTELFGGTIRFKDETIQGAQPNDIVRRGIGYVPQNENIFGKLTVRENLLIGGYVLEKGEKERMESVFDQFPVLRERAAVNADVLSGGQQKMLAIGRALMVSPDLLMLDEPSAGLAPDLVNDVFDNIVDINERGTGVLLVEQNATEALNRCDRGYVLVQGKNRFEGPGRQLIADEGIRREFLGG